MRSDYRRRYKKMTVEQLQANKEILLSRIIDASICGDNKNCDKYMKEYAYVKKMLGEFDNQL